MRGEQIGHSPSADRREAPLPTGFVNMLEARQRMVNSLLCVGLDPVLEKIPGSVTASVLYKRSQTGIGTVGDDNVDLVFSGKHNEAHQYVSSLVLEEFTTRIVDATHPYVSAFKPNIAFWERYGEQGLAALRRTIQHIRDVNARIPIILDAKRGDIGATNEGYADMLGDIGADAITVNPYFGIEGKGALDPFLNLRDKGIIILVRTSNPEAARMQDQHIIDAELGEVPYYMMVAHLAEKARQVNPNIGIVVGATAPEQLRAVRGVFKGEILVPGLGKQGGTAPDLMQAFGDDGLGVIANNASGIIHASTEDDFAKVAAAKSREWRDKINAVREATTTRMPDREKVIEEMLPVQREVAEMMLTAEVDGKLTRRNGEQGSFTYTKSEGRFPMVTIAQDPEHEFVGAANLRDPQNPDIPLLPYFANLRGGTPENYEVMARALAENNNPYFDFDYITGIPNTGNVIARALAEIIDVPYFDILEKSGEGADRQFSVRTFKEGEEKPVAGMQALVVDDLITRATTKIVAEGVLVDAGFEVAGHAVVYDREEGGMEEMREAGKIIVAALTATQLFAIAREMGKVSDDVYATIMGKIIAGKKERLLKRAS